jgi:hypothetical protein
LAAALLLAAAPAGADTPGQHLIGLFVQGCMPFLGDAAGLHAWAAKLRLPVLPPQVGQAFLQGQPGTAFDATDASGKLVLISDDDGTCGAVAERPDPSLAPELEQTFRRLGIGFSVTADRDDPEIKVLHYREYAARRGDRTWRVVVSTGTSDSGAHPMLSALPL